MSHWFLYSLCQHPTLFFQIPLGKVWLVLHHFVCFVFCFFPGWFLTVKTYQSLPPCCLSFLLHLATSQPNHPSSFPLKFWFLCNDTPFVVVFFLQICSPLKDLRATEVEHHVSFIKHSLHFLECLYDPYFVWRKRLRGWVAVFLVAVHLSTVGLRIYDDLSEVSCQPLW